MRRTTPQQIIQVLPQAEPIPKMAVSPEEAAERLSMSRTLFFELLAAKSIRAVRIGRKVIIPLTELEAFLERNLDQSIPLSA